MKIFEFIDYVQRRINSLLFRFIIITYSLLILQIHTNAFSNIYYTIGLFLYFFIYLKCLNHPKFRLLNDLLLMTFVIAGKNPNDVVIFVYLLLPAINSINFSGEKKSHYIYVYTFLIYVFLTCYYNNKYELAFIFNNYYPLFSLVFLWFIDLYTSLRTTIRVFRERLNEIVDSFYTDKETIKKPHKIYSLLIDAINKNIKKDLIQELFCFTAIKGNNEKLVIVNGSCFVWSNEFEDTDFISSIRKRKYIINTPLIIDNRRYNNNLSIFISIEDYEYIFTFITKSSIPFYYLMIGLFRTLEPSLLKMSRILLSEKRLQEIKNEELIKLSERSQYVNRANKTMHFIRNRLGPISNMVTMLDNLDSIQKDKVEDFKQLLRNEKARAKIELTNINERANYLLEKSNNPFNFCETSKFSLQKTFSILKRNFTSYFPDNNILILDNSNKEKQYVLINEEGFELFLSDWLNNIRKYKRDYITTEFIINQGELIIIFSNDFTTPISAVNQMISDLMFNERNEIMKRTTHGLYQIKTTLEEMSIPYLIEHNTETNTVVLKLTLKCIENENSSI